MSSSDVFYKVPEKSKGSRAAVAKLCHWNCCSSFGLLTCLADSGLTACESLIDGRIIILSPATDILYAASIEDQWYKERRFQGGKSKGRSLLSCSDKSTMEGFYKYIYIIHILIF